MNLPTQFGTYKMKINYLKIRQERKRMKKIIHLKLMGFLSEFNTSMNHFEYLKKLNKFKEIV
jgi:hypothetical protein